jgi:hypothetical protein
MPDVFTDALNAPSGRLAEIAIRKLTKADSGEPPDAVKARLERLVQAPGRPGRLARVRLAADVAFLFDRVPSWTKREILPLFDWSSPDAADVWSARRYSTYIGSPELFGLAKKPFLEMFERSDIPAEDLRTFADWLAAILLAKQEGVPYPLASSEARTALRHAGVEALSSVGHRLAMAMESAPPAEKTVRWRSVVGPVFQGIWPLDVELQTGESTFKLVQILRATGSAFGEAADTIVPFIQPEDPRRHSSVFSIAESTDDLYRVAPTKMLDLLSAVVGDAQAGSVYALSKALSKLEAADAELVKTRKYQKLMTAASRN